jgi:hypothetical protein
MRLISACAASRAFAVPINTIHAIDIPLLVQILGQSQLRDMGQL